MNGSRVIPYDELASAGSKETAASLWRLLVEFSRAVARDDPIAHRYLLLLRFSLPTAMALALVAAPWVKAGSATCSPPTKAACVGQSTRRVPGRARALRQQVIKLSHGLNELERERQGTWARALAAYLRAPPPGQREPGPARDRACA